MVTLADSRQGTEHDYKGLSTDTKPLDCSDNSLFFELDTGDFYFKNGTAWVKVGG